jgi:hypothetical protein
MDVLIITATPYQVGPFALCYEFSIDQNIDKGNHSLLLAG